MAVVIPPLLPYGTRYLERGWLLMYIGKFHIFCSQTLSMVSLNAACIVLVAAMENFRKTDEDA